MDELVEFLTARLDEDEAAALAAALGRHKFAEWQASATQLECVFLAEPTTGAAYLVATAGGEDDEDQARAVHIARHDPARVFREVEAKRKLMAQHEPYLLDQYRAKLYPGVVAQCDGCSDMCHSETGLRCDEPDAVWPCDTAKILALPYADHPDYRPEWRL